MDKVAGVGMSGGVDSAVAVLLLQNAGYEVFGFTMTVWRGETCYKGERCRVPAGEDVASAAAVAKKLGIKHFTVDLSAVYKTSVLDYFKAQYLAGNTPNPCFFCNSRVKLGALIGAARRLCGGFDCFATGHYFPLAYLGAASGGPADLVRALGHPVVCRTADPGPASVGKA